MNTLTIKLKQHTPLIHFQHDQDGATLRASEVKPKLDKFVLNNLTQNEYLQGVKEGWIKKKNDKVWLDYKMRIEAKGFHDILLPIKPVKKRGIQQTDEIGRNLYTTDSYPDNNSSLIMSNIGGRIKEEVHNFSMASSVQMTLLVSNIVLEKLLSKSLSEFFGKNSFGNRTSKGFGSFEVISINEQKESSDIYSDSYILSFTVNLGETIGNKSQVYQDVFKIIYSLWKKLKNISGVRGKAQNNVLLNIKPQNIKGAERIPSPICFKPLIDFYKEEGLYYCDVNISFLINKEVVKQVTGVVDITYYAHQLTKLKNNLGNELFVFLTGNAGCKIDRQSVSLE